MEILTGDNPITEFDIDLYFKIVEKMTVYGNSSLVVSLLDGSEIECEMNRV